MGPSKVFRFVACLFTLIGTLMLIGTGLWYLSTKAFITRATHAEGIVIDLVESDSYSRSSRSYTPTYRAVVSFKDAQGKEWTFTSSVSSSSPEHQIEEKVPVLYLPGQEHNAEINTFLSLWLGHLIFGGLGLIFFFIGSGFLSALIIVPALRSRKAERLRNQGIPIQVEFQGVERNTQITINGRNPFRLIAQWQDPATSKLHLFESTNLWFDPTPFINKKQLTVFIDPNNPRRYHLDISFLPELAD